MPTLSHAILLPKNCTQKFYCEKCDYGTSKKSSYDDHLASLKHNKTSSGHQNLLPFCRQHICSHCNKTYQDRKGLWRHKKSCHATKQTEEITHLDEGKIQIDKDEIIMMLITELKSALKEQQNMMMKVIENGTTNNNSHNTTTHTNSHNAFNLNFFLNETCKNAMNITDFVDSIKLQLTDFMDVGQAGFVQGISNIIVKRLNDLDETIRPIHCTDQKRETFYVKDENKWEKEEDDMKKIRKMIKKIAYKNETLMPVYKEQYPDYNDPASKRSDQYSKFVIEALGGDGDNSAEKENKIIRHISRATKIKSKE